MNTKNTASSNGMTVRDLITSLVDQQDLDMPVMFSFYGSEPMPVTAVDTREDDEHPPLVVLSTGPLSSK